MKLPKNGRIQKKDCNQKHRWNFIEKPSKSDIKWFLEKVFVPIALVVIPLSPSAIALIPALIPLATPLIIPPNTQQPANPAIDRTIPPSK